MNIIINTGKDLLSIIKENSIHQQNQDITSTLFVLANLIVEKEYIVDDKLTSILIELAEFTNEMEEDDIISLINFLIIIKKQDRTVFKAFEEKLCTISDFDKKAFMLRLLSILDQNSLSISLIKSCKEVVNRYPMFMADLLFDINPFEAIQLIRGKSFEFEDSFEILEKWLDYLASDLKFKELGKQLLSTLDKMFKNDSIYLEWKKMNKPEINIINDLGFNNVNEVLGVFDSCINN